MWVLHLDWTFEFSLHLHRWFQVSAPDADVIFRSSDNIQFHLHKKMLECATGGFPPSDVSVDTNENISLTESGKILEILFQFVYPRPYPSLKGFDLSSLLELAEAAEKYQVFSLMAITQLLLEFVDLGSFLKKYQLTSVYVQKAHTSVSERHPAVCCQTWCRRPLQCPPTHLSWDSSVRRGRNSITQTVQVLGKPGLSCCILSQIDYIC